MHLFHHRHIFSLDRVETISLVSGAHYSDLAFLSTLNFHKKPKVSKCSFSLRINFILLYYYYSKFIALQTYGKKPPSETIR